MSLWAGSAVNDRRGSGVVTVVAVPSSTSVPEGAGSTGGAGADEADDGHRRGRLWWAFWLVAAAVALAVGQPDLLLHADREQPKEQAPTPSPTWSPSTPPSEIAWNTRGDLAGDRAFVAEAVNRINRGRAPVTRVLFAGRLPDGSRLVIAFAAPMTVGLIVPPGGGVRAAEFWGTRGLISQVVTWAGEVSDGHTYAVVLARPGPVRFELSSKVLFDDGATRRRAWTHAASRTGVAIVDLGTDPDPVIAVRASGAGVFAVEPGVPVARPTAAAARVTVAGAHARTYAGPPPNLLVDGLSGAVGDLVFLEEARSRVLWSGMPWQHQRLALVLVTRPDGLRLQALVGETSGTVVLMGRRVLPADEPNLAPWLLETGSPREPTVLLCPTGRGTLVFRRPGQPNQRLPVPASGAVVLVQPAPDKPRVRDAEVTLLDRRGRTLLTTALPPVGHEDLFGPLSR